jgi:MtN3 and saliva related transmembrane protein
LLAIYKTKNVEGISLNMFLMLSIGVLLWLLYGILKSDIVLIIANVITSILLFINIVLVVKYQKKIKN